MTLPPRGQLDNAVEEPGRLQALQVARACLDHAPLAIFRLGLDGEVLEVNDQACLNLGYSRDELLGLTVVDYDPAMSREKWREFRRKLAVQGFQTFESLYRRKDGSTFPVEITLYDFQFQGSDFTYAFVQDIAERKRLETETSQRRLFLESVLASTPDAVVTADRQHHILEWNLGAEKLFGYTAAEACGHKIDELITGGRPEVLAEATQWSEQIQRSQGIVAAETVRFRKDGTPVAVRLSAAPLLDRGELGGAVAVYTDITESNEAQRLIQAQKEQLVGQNEELSAQNEELVSQGQALEAAEAGLRRINEELEQRIQARSAELSAANADLQLANAALVRAGRMKDEFLANMSHELRTPLNAILGFAELLDKGVYGDLTDKQRHPLQMMQDSAQHLLQLINDILDLSKVEAGRMELELAPVMVEEICQAGLQFVQQIARKKNVHLSLKLDSEIRHVLADGRRLKQMLINLLNNAVKFTPEGGQVGLEVARRGEGGKPKEVLFTVWDTGIGIAPEKQAQLFQPFVQLDGGLSRKYEGTGLGLALVQAMAELHGGRVSVESAGLGQGARFTVALPWMPLPLPRSSTDSSEADSGLESLAAILGRPPLVMAVDDSTMTLNVLTTFLEAMGCQVMTARNGTEALAALEEATKAAQPDLILLDIQLPGIDGLTVIRRARAAGSAVPIVALTALAMPSDRERCLEAGANDYLSKPVRLDDVARVIRAQLTRKA